MTTMTTRTTKAIRKLPPCARQGSLCGAHARGATTSSPCSDYDRKSKAELDAELAIALDEADLPRQSHFEEAKARQALLNEEVDVADAALNAFPRGPMGLVPDVVRSTSGYRAAKASFQEAFARQREFNAMFTKRFARELRAERAERTGAYNRRERR